MPPIQFLIERRESGRTVAEVLRLRFRLTWAQAKRLVERGHVRVAGQLTRAPEQRVKTGNRFWVAAGVIEVKPAAGAEKKKPAPPPTREHRADQPKRTPNEGGRGSGKKPAPAVNTVAIEVVYSDDAVVVVDKPAGVTTSRSKEDAEEFGRGVRYLPKTLAELMPAALGAPNRPVYAVHRLDRDTTGLLVFARTRAAATRLTAQFRKHTVDRRYLALTRGIPQGGRIESVLVPDRGDGRRGSGPVGAEDGRRAVTTVTVLEPLGQYALVECRLETGRTHQVRIHLGEAGHPLCGERLYDRPVHGSPVPDGSGAARPLLHAYRLGFEHPETGEVMGWEVDPPGDFAEAVNRAREATLPPGAAS
jgi:23S rRNA pseudouridine1911/1915/1917 synthase